MSDCSADLLVEYDDPILYDIENSIVDELPILLPLAQESGGPILDLACGTGRTTLPLAEAGFVITGVDISEPMLTRAREKARERGLAVDFHLQDCSRLDLPLTARMATMTGHAFQEFFTNAAQDALLRSVSRHLAPGGVFVFDSRFPSRENLLKPEGEQPWQAETTDQHGRALAVSVIWSYDALAQIQHYDFIERFTDATGATAERRSLGHLRYTWPREMERLLDMHGFDLETIYGEWDGSPLSADSYDMVVIARKRG
ncbi:MAG: methyltransferase domain-containing protein [Thermomicrobiales bacterium]